MDREEENTRLEYRTSSAQTRLQKMPIHSTHSSYNSVDGSCKNFLSNRREYEPLNRESTMVFCSSDKILNFYHISDTLCCRSWGYNDE